MAMNSVPAVTNPQSDAAFHDLLRDYQIAFDATDPAFIEQISELNDVIQDVLTTDESPNAIRAAILLLTRNLTTQLATLEPRSHSVHIGGSTASTPPTDMTDFLVPDNGPDSTPIGLRIILDQLFRPSVESPAPSPSQPNASTVENAWTKALADAEVTQGSGDTYEEPRFTYGRKDLAKAPVIVRPTIDISPHVSKEKMCQIQDRILARLTAFQWENRGHHMKLHPWAVIAWVNIFTTDMFGVNGIKLINDILKAAADRNEHGDTHGDIMHAFKLSIQPDFSSLEREVFRALGAVMSQGMTRTNAWTRFKHRFDACILAEKIDELRDEVTASPRAPNSIRLLNQPTGPGISVRDRIMITLASDMQWKPSQLEKVLKRNRVFNDCCQTIHPGMLLLMRNKIENSFKSNGKAALPFILDAVMREFPELKNMCEILGDMIIPSLMSEKEAERRKVVGKTIPTTVRGSDMMSRIGETLTTGNA